MSRPRAAFTLVELLVVITIVAMLLAMLLPAVGKARDLAKVALCLSNQRQMSMLAAGSYVADNRGYIVPALGQSAMRSGVTNVYIAPDLSSNQPNMSTFNVEMWELMDPASAKLTQTPAAIKPRYAYCPGAPALWRGHAYSYPYYEANYAINIYLTRYGGPSNPQVLATRADNVKKPGDKLLLAETHQLALHGVRGSYSVVYPGLYAMVPLFPQPMQIAGWTTPVSPQRHSQGFTASYNDGHAEFVKHPTVYSAFWLTDTSGVTASLWFSPTSAGLNYRAIWDPTY